MAHASPQVAQASACLTNQGTGSTFCRLFKTICLYSEQLQGQTKCLSWAQAKSAYCAVARTHTVSMECRTLKRKPPLWEAEAMLRRSVADQWAAPLHSRLERCCRCSETAPHHSCSTALQLRPLPSTKSSVCYVLQREGYVIFIP